MIDAAQPHAHHQQHRQLQRAHQVQLVQRGRDRRQPAANALHHHDIGLRTQARERGHDRRQFHLHAIFGSGQLRCQRLPQRIRVQVGIVRYRPTGRLQGQRVFVAQALPQILAAAGHRLHADRAQATAAQCVQQRGADRGLADLGVGTGDEQGRWQRGGQRHRWAPAGQQSVHYRRPRTLARLRACSPMPRSPAASRNNTPSCWNRPVAWSTPSPTASPTRPTSPHWSITPCPT
ncbi:hypothetical protein G6F35_013962 [Rhizopus arrhizus]|nr:hypothetical protein G6F35_013962 [Rhizopus arrhizus]